MNLFKIDSKGKIRILHIEATGDTVTRNAGIYRGNLVYTDKKCKGKNIGKSNETTPVEQAEIEAAAERIKKIREGYVYVQRAPYMSTPEIKVYINENSLDIPDCMLAKDYKETYVDWKGGAMSSAKLDGMRCMAVISFNKVQLFSRGRKDIIIMQHIEKVLLELHQRTGFTGILDGELYYHDQSADNFQTIMKACKKYRKGITEMVEYHVYELINPMLTAIERYRIIEKLLTTRGIVRKVLQYRVLNYTDAMNLHEKFLSLGFEGSIVKNMQSAYREGARSSDLLKIKDFTEGEFEILDIIPMDNYPTQGKAVVRDPKTGVTFKATPKMTHSERKALLINKDTVIGHSAIIKYFGLTDAGIPRIANLKSIILPGDAEDFRLINK